MKAVRTSIWIPVLLFGVAALAPAAPVDEATPQAAEASAVEQGLGHKLLLYVPNRLLDVCDVFRVRLRVEPGWGVGFRVTQRLAFFGGNYRTVYAGLPGPRAPHCFKSPVGYESQKGIVFVGVDATDKSPHPPGYTLSEIEGGIQCLVGADVGFDFWEVADFLTGLVLVDLRKDDL